MSAIVDYQYYSAVYMGTEADQASFPALDAHAERMIASMARWRVNSENISELPAIIQTQYKLAICSQIDFLSLNGLESINDTGDGGFTVGKVSVHSKQRSGSVGAMSESISPASVSYLEQTGLMSPSVPVWGGVI